MLRPDYNTLSPSSSASSSPDRSGNHARYSIPMKETLTMERVESGISNYSCNSTVNLVRDRGHEEDGQTPAGSGSCWRWSTRSRRRGQSHSKPPDLEKRRTPESSGGKAGSLRFLHGWRVILLDSWLNMLLVLLPVSWVMEYILPDSSVLVFIFCVLSMIPLVKLHDLATSELALRIGGSKTGLLNASMSNTVELVFAISALRKCELRVVQSSLVGAILSKLLLVLGMCFFAGGTRFTEQGFDATATHIHSSLLIISVSALLLPCAYHFTISRASEREFDDQKQDILRMSHGVSVILLLIYASYLLFQLYSHTHLYKDPKTASNKLVRGPKLGKSSPSKEPLHSLCLERTQTEVEVQTSPRHSESQWIEINHPGSFHSRKPYSHSPIGSAAEMDLKVEGRDSATVVGSESDKGSVASRGAVPAPDVDPTVKLVQAYYTGPSVPSSTSRPDEKPEEKRIERVDNQVSTSVHFVRTLTQEEHNVHARHPNLPRKEPQLSWLMTLTLLTSVTVMVAVNADELVESMDGVSTRVSKTWIALILLPAVSSIVECITAINTSVKDELTLSISVAVGSTVQTALFVIPFIVLLGWVMNKPLALLFDPFESVVLYISVHTMSSVVQDGKSNWLEGVILVCLYVIIAVAFWFYPGSDVSNTLAICRE